MRIKKNLNLHAVNLRSQILFLFLHQWSSSSPLTIDWKEISREILIFSSSHTQWIYSTNYCFIPIRKSKILSSDRNKIKCWTLGRGFIIRLEFFFDDKTIFKKMRMLKRVKISFCDFVFAGLAEFLITYWNEQLLTNWK